VCRPSSQAGLEARLADLRNASMWGGTAVADNILVVSLGDEISVPTNLATDAGFVQWPVERPATKKKFKRACVPILVS